MSKKYVSLDRLTNYDALIKKEIADSVSGKADSGHSHDIATQSENGLLSAEDKIQLDYGGTPIVTTSGTGSAYTATIDGMTLTAGVSFVMIPHTVSTTTSPTLNINGLGAKNIRRRLSSATTSTTKGYNSSWLSANKPIRVTYDGTFWIADLTKPSAADLSGTVTIAQGGTGATDGATGLANLFAAGTTVLSSYQYGSALPENAEDGTLFLKEYTGGISEISDTLISDLMLKAYPVGSIYISVNSTSPASLFGGTWTRIVDRFLIGGQSSTYPVGSTGGEASHTLTANEMPSHSHTYTTRVNWENTASSGLTSTWGTANMQIDTGTKYYTDNTGGGAAHNNMPPYLSVYMWKRTA